MLEILYGPDGIGKSAIIRARQQAGERLAVLHGTNAESWFTNHADLLAEHGLEPEDIPPDTEFEAKIALLNMAALALDASGLEVIVDGHALHKTVINIAAGRSKLPIAPAGTGPAEQIEGPLGFYFDQLDDLGAVHTHVVVPGLTNDEVGRVLQTRLHHRGKLSPWDPQSIEESTAQVQASYELEQALIRRGSAVRRAVSNFD